MLLRSSCPPLHTAAFIGSPTCAQVIRTLLDGAADPNRRAPDSSELLPGGVPLRFVLLSGRRVLRHAPAQHSAEPIVLRPRVVVYTVEIASMLLDARADPNGGSSGDASAVPPLHLALTTEHGRLHEIVSLLLRSRADPETHDSFGRTALLAAAGANERLDNVRLLLEARAHMDAVDPEGNSALHFASMQRNFGIMALLQERGCEARPNNLGQLPIDVQGEEDDMDFDLFG